MLLTALHISFSVAQGEQICFYEDLPGNSHLRGYVGAQTDITVPQISFLINYNASGLFGNVDIGESEQFDILTEHSGQYELCFSAMRIDQHPAAKRGVNFELEVGELPGVGSDKTAGAQRVKDYAVDVTKEQSYGLARLESLANLGNEASRAVFAVGLTSIAIVVAAVALQAFWLTIEVKKRS